MNRRKQRKQRAEREADRNARLKKLLARGWIRSEAEIPADAIPVDPDRINLGGSWSYPTCYRDLEFTCLDCKSPQIWKAEDQRWYYETSDAPYYVTAIRCLTCRKKERERKNRARIAAGHAPRTPPTRATSRR